MDLDYAHRKLLYHWCCEETYEIAHKMSGQLKLNANLLGTSLWIMHIFKLFNER